MHLSVNLANFKCSLSFTDKIFSTYRCLLQVVCCKMHKDNRHCFFLNTEVSDVTYRFDTGFHIVEPNNIIVSLMANGPLTGHRIIAVRLIRQIQAEIKIFSYLQVNLYVAILGISAVYSQTSEFLAHRSEGTQKYRKFNFRK